MPTLALNVVFIALQNSKCSNINLNVKTKHCLININFLCSVSPKQPKVIFSVSVENDDMTTFGAETEAEIRSLNKSLNLFSMFGNINFK